MRPKSDNLAAPQSSQVELSASQSLFKIEKLFKIDSLRSCWDFDFSFCSQHDFFGRDFLTLTTIRFAISSAFGDFREQLVRLFDLDDFDDFDDFDDRRRLS